jgi:hypothetical protein
MGFPEPAMEYARPATTEDQVGRLFENIDKPIIVFYIGDHDASGDLIGEDMHRRVEIASGVSFQMKRLAIHAEDIKAFGLHLISMRRPGSMGYGTRTPNPDRDRSTTVPSNGSRSLESGMVTTTG